jgi:hypothetical protein
MQLDTHVRLAAPTDLESLPTPISLLALKGRCRRRGSQGRVFTTEGEATHRAHSGNPAFRRPSISSFEFDCPPREIYADIVKAGSVSSCHHQREIRQKPPI